MPRHAVSSTHAPAAIGPYSQAIVAGGLVHCSGQVALHPETGELIEGDVEAQTRRVMENLSSVLHAAGTSLAHAVKCTIYLKDMNDFAAVNAAYAEVFASAPPARATVEVSRLPKDVLVEIDAVAAIT